MQYYGLLDHSGNPIVSQGPRDPRLQKLEPPGDYPDPSIEKPLWRVLKRWNALFDFDPRLSKRDAIAYLRMRYYEHPEGFPDWHKIGDWVREYLRGEGYRSTGKGHFLQQPDVIRFQDDPETDPDGETGEEKLERLLIDRASQEELETKARKWFLTGCFWSYLKQDPELEKKLVDITEAQSWNERAKRWGFATRGGAQRYAQNTLRKRLLALADGKAAKILFKLHRL